MDAILFDRLTRRLSRVLSRRATLTAAALGAMGLAGAAEAGPGCRNVGKRCRNAEQCCSGICRGKRGRRRCKAHDTGGCPVGETAVLCGGPAVPCTTATGEPGTCATTTGNAAYCAGAGDCRACTRDADCQTVCGSRAACIHCGCALGTACYGPDAATCPL